MTPSPRRFLSLLALLALPALPALAQDIAPDPALYQCRVYVTGSDMRSRPAGLARCVRDVLVKVAGDPGLLDDPRLAPLDAGASGMVQDFVYLDRMTDEPNHDEQGSRDRPFDLVAHVDPKRVAAALHELGLAPWTAPRPVLLALVDVQNKGTTFNVTADGPFGERQRRALLDAGETYGMRVAIPTVQQWAGLDARRPDLGRFGLDAANVTVLTGTMTWSDADAGWNCTWRADIGGQAREWSVRGVSFDEGFRAGVGQMAKALAALAR